MAAENRANSLTFRCPKTGKEFYSGFQVTPDELKNLPPDYKIAVRCKSCFEMHEFTFSEAKII